MLNLALSKVVTVAAALLMLAGTGIWAEAAPRAKSTARTRTKGPRTPVVTESGDKRVKTLYPTETEIDFEGLAIEGEIRSPGEFYFQKRPEEKFDSLVKRRKNFHREMLRDSVLSK